MIEAAQWNERASDLKKCRAISGRGCRAKETPRGTVVSGEQGQRMTHPWQVTAYYHATPNGDGEWQATVRPGFVNGRDTLIEMAEDWLGVASESSGSDVPSRRKSIPLTDEPRPYLVLDRWRNPLQSAELKLSPTGELTRSPAEGYPRYFDQFGIRAPDPGGDAFSEGSSDASDERIREIRAIDIVLSQARFGTRLQYDVLAAPIDGQTEAISFVTRNEALLRTGGQARLRVTSKYTPPSKDGLAVLYSRLFGDGDTQMDEIKIATVWMISPPYADPDSLPDQSWESVPQHFVFWNLMHASRVIIGTAPQAPIRLITGLAGGVADRINDALLSYVNDHNAEATAFFAQVDARGKFWSV